MQEAYQSHKYKQINRADIITVQTNSCDRLTVQTYYDCSRTISEELITVHILYSVLMYCIDMYLAQINSADSQGLKC